MSDIVQETMNRWTAGADDGGRRVRIFSQIRDIPYAVIPELRNRFDGPAGILRQQCGSCTPKHFLLGRMFELIEIPVHYLTFPFSWNQPHLPYPETLRLLAEGIPTEYHLAVHAYINGRWVVVDATWDTPLARHGFPVNQLWDGVSDTTVALEYLEMIVHESAEERDRYVEQQKASWTDEYHRREDAFIAELNRWLESLRQ